MMYYLTLSTSMSYYWCKTLFLKAIRSHQSIMLHLRSFRMLEGNAVFYCLDYVFVLDAEERADWTLLANAVPSSLLKV